jgi:hypothetical protein
MPNNADLHKRRIAAIPRGVGNSLAVYAERRTRRRSHSWQVLADLCAEQWVLHQAVA